MIDRDSWLAALTLISLATCAGVVRNSLADHPLPLGRPYLSRAPLPVASVDQARAWQQSHQALFVDTRTPPEFLGGHIPDALNLCTLNFERALPPCLESLKRADRVVVYGSDSNSDVPRSLARRLQSQAVETKLFVLSDGLQGWRIAGLQVTDPPPREGP